MAHYLDSGETAIACYDSHNMDYNQQPLFHDPSVDVITDQTDVVDEQAVLSLNIDDRQLISNFRRWIDDSKDYWDNTDGCNLENVRNQNERYFLGKQIDKTLLYPHQVPYQENIIFTDVQAIMAYVTASEPSCEVVPDNDKTQSMVMAEDLERAINIHTERHKLAEKIKSAVKNMYLKRVGIIKLMWDEKSNDIKPVAVDPARVILDKNCLLGEEPRFICEVCLKSAGELVKQFPDKKDALLKALGRERWSQKLLNEMIAYNEIWFTDDTADYGEQECVAWYYKDIIFDKMKNPNYLYDGEGVAVNNFLDRPTKPYVFFNYINDGSSLIDQTTPLEQVIPLQDILNKRGRQIVENADTANSILVFKAGAIKQETAENITRDPNQKILLETAPEQPVSSAYGEIEPHLLPNYVINDKQDIKNAIHDILGAPSQFRGSDSDNNVNTLGEAQMIKSQASGRQDEIVRAIEMSLDSYFKLLVQMMKVYYDEKHPFATRDTDGKFVYTELSRATMPDIASISISHGSLLKVDRERRENVAMAMAKMGLIDPYNLFKDLSLHDADKRYEALVKFKVDPTSLVSDVKTEVNNREAYIDFATIMGGNNAEPRQDIDPGYILAMRKLLMTDQFLYAKPDRQKKLLDYIQGCVIDLGNRVRLEQADQAGLLVDPSIPITPEAPEVPPEMMAQRQPQPPMPPDQAQPEQPPIQNMPNVPNQEAPVSIQDAGIPQDAISTLGGLLGG